jgi:hypothetical protein
MTKVTSAKSFEGNREIGRFTVLRIPHAKPLDPLQWAATDIDGTVLFQARTMSECLNWAKAQVEGGLISQSR